MSKKWSKRIFKDKKIAKKAKEYLRTCVYKEDGLLEKCLDFNNGQREGGGLIRVRLGTESVDTSVSLSVKKFGVEKGNCLDVAGSRLYGTLREDELLLLGSYVGDLCNQFSLCAEKEDYSVLGEDGGTGFFFYKLWPDPEKIEREGNPELDRIS
jgi:hypothetical protein